MLLKSDVRGQLVLGDARPRRRCLRRMGLCSVLINERNEIPSAAVLALTLCGVTKASFDLIDELVQITGSSLRALMFVLGQEAGRRDGLPLGATRAFKTEQKHLFDCTTVYLVVPISDEGVMP